MVVTKRPCAVGECTALALSQTGLCSVHSKANEGPHASKCEKCRKPIERGEFWIHFGVDEMKVAHPSCLVAKPKTKRQKRGWMSGFGKDAA